MSSITNPNDEENVSDTDVTADALDRIDLYLEQNSSELNRRQERILDRLSSTVPEEDLESSELWSIYDKLVLGDYQTATEIASEYVREHYSTRERLSHVFRDSFGV